MAVRGLYSRGVPAHPPYFNWIGLAICGLSIIVLGNAAYAISLGDNTSHYYDSGAPGFLLFVVIFSWIVYGTTFAVECKAPQLYYRICVLAAYILLLLFWTAGWTWAASWASYSLSFHYRPFGDALAACAGIGAVIWVFTIAVLFVFGRACMRDSKVASRTADVELGQLGPSNAYQPRGEYTHNARPIQN